MGFVAFPVGLCVTAFAIVDQHPPRRARDRAAFLRPRCLRDAVSTRGFAVNHTAPEATGAVGGILNATRQVGSTIAAAVTSAALTQDDDGLWTAIPFLIAAAICVLGLCSAIMRTFARASSSSQRRPDKTPAGSQTEHRSSRPARG